ncbi:MAG: peptidoglycan-binding protein [Candidatus Yonathbacteria bacterium]|nr:peptidoglycan-binding protein [Candidatus Yonathbacteria bacterium]
MIKKIFAYLIVLSVFLFPGFTFAMSETQGATNYVSNISSYSEEDLVALITKLQNQLEEIRKNKVQCILAGIDLSIGDGEDDGLKEYVMGLQNFLKEKGYFKNKSTGYFGKLTRAALKNFQKDIGIDQTGELNAGVRASVKNLKCQKDFQIKKAETEYQKKETVGSVGTVTSIALEVNGNMAKWSTVGYSKEGFKIVWSKNPHPTYPTRNDDKYLYTSDTGSSSATLDAFNGTGTYYARACEYLGGSCGIYSNEITLSL